MRILSLDQASVATGWAILENDKLEEHGIIDLHKEKNLSKDDRFFLMCNEIKQLIEEKMPELLVFEEVTAQGNANTARLLARLQGFIIGVAMTQDLNFNIIYPSSWRKSLGFKQGGGTKRKELKQQAIDFVKCGFSIEVDEDIADAICIGYSFALDNLKLREI